MNKYYYSVLRIFATRTRFYMIFKLFYVVVIIILLFVYRTVLQSKAICFLEAP